MESPRKHFEAVLKDLADFYGEDREALREDLKAVLMRHKVIAFSTVELRDEALEKLADRLHAFYFDQKENTPPQFRAELNFEKILF